MNGKRKISISLFFFKKKKSSTLQNVRHKGRFSLKILTMFLNECNWMGCGVVVRDHEGLVCAALSKTIDGCPDPTTAEAMGALCAIVEVANSFRSCPDPTIMLPTVWEYWQAKVPKRIFGWRKYLVLFKMLLH
jgi:hypothetical protein